MLSPQAERAIVEDILDTMPKPPGVTGYRYIFDETPFGEPALTIRFVVADDQLNAEWQRKYGFDLFHQVWKLLQERGIERFPFISLTSESDNPELLIYALHDDGTEA